MSFFKNKIDATSEDFRKYWESVQNEHKNKAKEYATQYNIESLSQAWNLYSSIDPNVDSKKRDLYWNIYVYIRDTKYKNTYLGEKFLEEQKELSIH